MLICAEAIVQAPGQILRLGCLRLEGGTILEVGQDLRPLPCEEVLHLPGITLAPGFINLHAHLELDSLHAALSPTPDFAAWLKQLITLLPSLTPEIRRASIAASSHAASLTGTTSILSITSNLPTLTGLTSTATRTWWALEFIDLFTDSQPSETLDRVTTWLSRHPTNAWHLALSPHAPYTASPSLYQSVAALAVQHHLPFTTHLAESTQETELLRQAQGSLRALLPSDLSRPDFQGNRSPLDWAQRNQALPDNPILAHLNEVQESDLPYLLDRKASVVHCPSAHAWFQRKPFPYQLFRQAKLPLCLGTDSPACSPNRSLDLRKEVRLFLKSQPEVTTDAAWSMITTGPALALGQAGKLGVLTKGAHADWVGWRIPPGQDPIPTILQTDQPPEITCVAGRVTHHLPI